MSEPTSLEQSSLETVDRAAVLRETQWANRGNATAIVPEDQPCRSIASQADAKLILPFAKNFTAAESPAIATLSQVLKSIPVNRILRWRFCGMDEPTKLCRGH